MNRVRALTRIRAARTIAQAGDEPGVETIGSAASFPHAEAVRAYRSMLPQDLKRGPLYDANQIMQTEVIRLNAGDSVAHAWRILRDHTIIKPP